MIAGLYVIVGFFGLLVIPTAIIEAVWGRYNGYYFLTANPVHGHF